MKNLSITTKTRTIKTIMMIQIKMEAILILKIAQPVTMVEAVATMEVILRTIPKNQKHSSNLKLPMKSLQVPQ